MSEHLRDHPAEHPGYTEYHPRWLRRRPSTYWWLERRAYVSFITRELSSIFIAWFIVYLLLFIRAVSRGDASYQQFLAWSRHPVVLVLSVVTFLFVVFHAFTWFNLAPKAMVVRMGGRPVPPRAVLVAHYGLWVVCSVVVAWVVLG